MANLGQMLQGKHLSQCPVKTRNMYQSISPGSRHMCMFHDYVSFYSEDLSEPHPPPKLDHPLSVVHDCSFSIFTATLHIAG